MWWPLGVLIGVMATLLTPQPAQADFMCRVLAVCTFEGRPFRLKVVDAETGQPLADVHALAEWILYGYHGVNGPLMVQDAVSGPEGVIDFRAWGPISGPKTGLVHGEDPAMTLFKPGYRTLSIQNRYPPGTEETTRVRVFGQDGQTFAMEPFRGTPGTWVEELRKATWGYPGGKSDEALLQFRGPYLNRQRRLWAERDKVPIGYQKPGQFFWHLERNLRDLQEDR